MFSNGFSSIIFTTTNSQVGKFLSQNQGMEQSDIGGTMYPLRSNSRKIRTILLTDSDIKKAMSTSNRITPEIIAKRVNTRFKVDSIEQFLEIFRTLKPANDKNGICKQICKIFKNIAK